ncbi:pyridoxamine 5'-phosphate oxidase family protein [Campylobacter sp. MG1]|uniref:pyridoxamine 5'-phosphate oxidase family protein n=1 Tax=Campylobacter sp. MG1 TaxID=2976332 RepID=UPI00226C6FE6|nr:pyridoxamine 5'-phosphate oxidase family protein [Campylobacter sp. MG1]
MIDLDIDTFKKSFKSVVIASIDNNGNAISSYAPIIFDGNDMYIFISEVVEHFNALKFNPNKVEIMFLQDESKAKTIFARIRLRYKVNAKILNRDDDFNRLFSLLKEQQNDENIDIFYNMQDFHFVKLIIKSGRFVKGFGMAYDIDENNKTHLANINSPHKFNK